MVAKQFRCPTIVAGDFNSVRAHPDFRSLSTGLLDADGVWPVATWPANRSHAPQAGTEHILARNLEPTQFQSLNIKGSDHSAITATLVGQ
ncbi:endonuclease/exonuclease/phosphatase family protein [Glutamicibacter sp. NPDC087344]|uniref:endonuclease/exonuclease/phosphatase family protein n=1 Tax=Glutamicibacter sp. NPDC087344 TaxID=3363994 RepID=UPI003805CE66